MPKSSVVWNSGTKLIIGHAGWREYLFSCKMSQLTASRQKRLVLLFLKWWGVLKPGDKFSETHIVQGLELVFSKSFKMNDFQEHAFELNREAILDSLQVEEGGSPSRDPSPAELLGFDFKKVLKGLGIIGDTQHEWKDFNRLK